MVVYKCFNINDNVHHLYLPRKLGGSELLSVENVIYQEKLALEEYLEASTEPLLQKVHACNWFNCSETPSVFKSRQVSEKFSSMENKEFTWPVLKRGKGKL